MKAVGDASVGITTRFPDDPGAQDQRIRAVGDVEWCPSGDRSQLTGNSQ